MTQWLSLLWFSRFLWVTNVVGLLISTLRQDCSLGILNSKNLLAHVKKQHNLPLCYSERKGHMWKMSMCIHSSWNNCEHILKENQ